MSDRPGAGPPQPLPDPNQGELLIDALLGFHAALHATHAACDLPELTDFLR